MTPVRLQTHVWNPMGQRRALLLHGLGSDGQTWWRVASRLADEGYLVLAPDLRSHGRSPTAVDHSLASMAGDVALLGDAHDLVVAHGLGGALAALLLDDRGFADAALLLDPLLVVPPDREPLRDGLHGVATQDPAALRARHPRWHERDVQRASLASAAVTPDVVDAVLDDNPVWDLEAVVERGTARLHLVAADPVRGSALAPDLLERLVDGGRVTGEVVTGSGHEIHRDDPGRVCTAIAELDVRRPR